MGCGGSKKEVKPSVKSKEHVNPNSAEKSNKDDAGNTEEHKLNIIIQTSNDNKILHKTNVEDDHEAKPKQPAKIEIKHQEEVYKEQQKKIESPKVQKLKEEIPKVQMHADNMHYEEKSLISDYDMQTPRGKIEKYNEEEPNDDDKIEKNNKDYISEEKNSEEKPLSDEKNTIEDKKDEEKHQSNDIEKHIEYEETTKGKEKHQSNDIEKHIEHEETKGKESGKKQELVKSDSKSNIEEVEKDMENNEKREENDKGRDDAKESSREKDPEIKHAENPHAELLNE
ncbi:hypothetical protein SteCoe_34521 [Stentor coeruleus]|uniref:Uncharacterized protein n=1 Tax=Stentor coeruleus TaxID=5963 RepID=A0A1R2AUC7_9CILI|nr:hypothetical protein SteCoe_34521 [Stentor coeruleus]